MPLTYKSAVIHTRRGRILEKAIEKDLVDGNQVVDYLKDPWIEKNIFEFD